MDARVQPPPWQGVDGCPICDAGRPLDVIVELDTTWVTAQEVAPLPGYACVVGKRHVEEPFLLADDQMIQFWRESMHVARALYALYRPARMNYEIHVNSIPHLHLHLFQRYAGDPYYGRSIDLAGPGFSRTAADLRRMADVIT
jgi:diadenosine tetraphosphate (Ap4A) HIT family hydrolase